MDSISNLLINSTGSYLLLHLLNWTVGEGCVRSHMCGGTCWDYRQLSHRPHFPVGSGDQNLCPSLHGECLSAGSHLPTLGSLLGLEVSNNILHTVPKFFLQEVKGQTTFRPSTRGPVYQPTTAVAV